ncbi:MAG TPA: hypothetical protein VGL72_22660 [Bryobacteraceae bacterium]
MATSIHLITRAEFADMHDPAGGRLELRHGEIVTVTTAKYNEDDSVPLSLMRGGSLSVSAIFREDVE